MELDRSTDRGQIGGFSSEWNTMTHLYLYIILIVMLVACEKGSEPLVMGFVFVLMLFGLLVGLYL
jgi:hypothetical protein